MTNIKDTNSDTTIDGRRSFPSRKGRVFSFKKMKETEREGNRNGVGLPPTSLSPSFFLTGIGKKDEEGGPSSYLPLFFLLLSRKGREEKGGWPSSYPPLSFLSVQGKGGKRKGPRMEQQHE